MLKAYLDKAWRDVRSLTISCLPVPVALQIVATGFLAFTTPAVLIIIGATLAARLGGESTLNGTRDLMQSRPMDHALHALVRYALGLTILSIYGGWCSLLTWIEPDVHFWKLFDEAATTEVMHLAPGLYVQGSAALFLAYSLAFALARETRSSRSVAACVIGATCSVVGLVIMVWTWKLDAAHATESDSLFSDVTFVAGFSTILVAAGLATVAAMRSRARMRT